MRRVQAVAAFIIALAGGACGTTEPEPLAPLDDAALTADVAASAGYSVFVLLHNLLDHEGAASGGTLAGSGDVGGGVLASIGRLTTCQDLTGQDVSNCSPFASVRSIVTVASMNGTRSSDQLLGRPGVTWTGIIHHQMSDTTRRVFVGTNETARAHTGVEVGTDTTTFYDGLTIRRLSETTLDSIRAVTFSLPHTTFVPASGTFVRRVTGRVEITRANRTSTHDFTRRVEVVFAAPVGGTIPLRVDGVTCQLSLTNGIVSNCA